MYQLVSSIGKAQSNSRWEDLEIGDMPLNTLLKDYRKVWAILTNPFIDHQVAFDLDNLRAQYAGRTITFSEFLTLNGSNTLQTTDTLPVINSKYVKYSDAVRAGWKIEPIHQTAAEDTQLPVSELNHLHMTHASGGDYADATNYHLFSVNGYYHYHDGSTQGVFIKDGMKTIRHSGIGNVGVLSFVGVGQIELRPITADMIYKQTEDQSLCNQCYLDIGEDIGNDKQVMIVIGGHLHALDEKILTRLGGPLFKINFKNYPILDRYFESREFMDLSSLPLTETSLGDGAIEVPELLSDDAIRALLSLSQSFLVVLDSPEFFKERVHVTSERIPNLHISPIAPEYPLIVGVGRTTEYIFYQDGDQWVINTADSFYHNRTYNTRKARELPNVNAARLFNNPVNTSAAFMLRMGKDL